jgi:hypothetical protein
MFHYIESGGFRSTEERVAAILGRPCAVPRSQNAPRNGPCVPRKAGGCSQERLRLFLGAFWLLGKAPPFLGTPERFPGTTLPDSVK